MAESLEFPYKCLKGLMGLKYILCRLTLAGTFQNLPVIPQTYRFNDKVGLK